jgi:hypothetical protein
VLLATVLLLVAWGALAFGAVYPWAFTPLLIGCALVGVLGLVLHRRRVISRPARAVIIALVCVIIAGLLQVVPLPAGVLRTLSPATDAFLRNYDIGYALGDARSAPDGSVLGASWHPLSLAPKATLLGLSFLAAFTLFLAGLLRALSASRVRRLAVLIIGFGVILALVGIVQKAVLGDHAWVGMKIYGFWAPASLLTTPFGPYVNKNHFAGWMLMAIPLALGFAIGTAEQAMRHVNGGWRSVLLWFSSPDGGRLQLTLLAVLVMGASLLMTKSRSGVAALIISLVFVSIASGRRFGSARAGWAALGSLGVLFLVLFSMAGADFTERIRRMEGTDLRKDIWIDSASVIRDFPLTGTGLNTFGTAMIGYQGRGYDHHFQEAHNEYLQVLVEGGLLLALPALAALILIVRAIRRRFAAHEDDALTWWVRAGAITGLLAIAAQSVVEFSLQMPGNAALCVVLLALALHEPHRRTPSPAQTPQP